MQYIMIVEKYIINDKVDEIELKIKIYYMPVIFNTHLANLSLSWILSSSILEYFWLESSSSDLKKNKY